MSLLQCFHQVLLLQVLIIHISAQGFYYVKSKDSIPCPDGKPCLAIDQLAYSNREYVTTGSTFVFMPGNHSLDTELKIASVSDVTLRGYGNNSNGQTYLEGINIRCDNVSNLHIEALTMILCRKDHCNKIEPGMYFSDSDQIMISNIISITYGVNGTGTPFGARSILSHHSNLTVRNCHFEGNSGRNGGAIKGVEKSNITVIGSTFTRNRAVQGGAITITNGIIILKGFPKNVFTRNRVVSAEAPNGGAIFCDNCTITLMGNNTFESNGELNSRVQSFGGAMSVQSSELIFMSGNTVFTNNEAFWGGALEIFLSEMSCKGIATVTFKGNTAVQGGGMYVDNSPIETSICNLTFTDNFSIKAGAGARIDGGTLGNSVNSKLVGDFVGNRAVSGGVLTITNMINITLKCANFVNNSDGGIFIVNSEIALEEINFYNNQGGYGVGIHALDSKLSFKDNILFSGNTAIDGAAIYLTQTTVFFTGRTTFTNNSARSRGGAIYSQRSVLDLEGTVNFTLNSAQNGGTVYMVEESTITMSSNSHFMSFNNSATEYGGGIYNEDAISRRQCTYDENRVYNAFLFCCITFKKDIDYIEAFDIIPKNFSISSQYDSAGIDGSFLYGGLLDRCQLKMIIPCGAVRTRTMYHFLVENTILTVETKDNETQAITSKPYALCFCDKPNHTPDCTGSRNLVIHRGQTFSVALLAIAQGNSTAPSSVTAIISPTASLKLGQNLNTLPARCSSLTYNLYSTNSNEELILYPEGSCRDTGFSRASINLTLLPCPDGFVLASDGQCVCEGRLRQYNVSCTIDEDVYFTKKLGSEFWMGGELINGSHDLILYKTCPVEYCKTDEVNMTLQDLDVQCANGRVGVLCGDCAENYSLLIGSTKCRECSNIHLVLLILFATAGVVLVGFLSILRLTVAAGMINSLILYANIVQANRRLFFPANTVNVLTVFIAWLNLDLGFETCFYNGMDAFVQTCLQFAFPVYVWVLISLIILTSRYSIVISKLIGHNPVAVLATLLLMSYTKVLKIIIEVFSAVKLDYPQDRVVTVWLKDANVPYLQSKHLALTVVTSLVLVFLFLPYTLLLLLGHRLYRFSGKKYLRWLNRLKPFLDSYYAPYEVRTRYWTGFLLLIRCGLYIIFSFNSFGGTRESFLAIITTFTALGFVVGFLYSGKIYKNSAANILEALAYLNLITLSAVVALTTHETVLAYILIGIVFVSKAMVILYHFHVLYIAKSALWLNTKANLNIRFRKSAKTDGPPAVPTAMPSQDAIVSKTVIDLREPLLEEN